MVSVKKVALQAVLHVTVVVGALVLKTVVHRVAVAVLLPLHVVVVAVVVWERVMCVARAPLAVVEVGVVVEVRRVVVGRWVGVPGACVQTSRVAESSRTIGPTSLPR
jgi:hypothetical protein